MPNGKAHVGLGVAAWYCIHPELDVTYVPAIVGALLPDADHPRAPAGRVLPLWMFLRHRGWTHTVWGLLLFSFIALIFIGWDRSLSFCVGYLSHLLADSLTPSGVHWLGKQKRPR